MSEFDVHVRAAKIYGWNGTREREIGIEPTTRAMMVIDYPHAEAHKKRSYITVYSGLKNDTEFIEVRIQAADTARLPHLEIAIETSLAATAEFWKDTTKTDVVLNRLGALNRRFDAGASYAAGMISCHTPGGANTGDADLTKYIGAAATGGRVAIGGGASSRGEFILERASSHDILVTSRSDGNAMTIELDWYEHTDKEA